MTRPIRVLHLGTSSRAHILAETLLKSGAPVENHLVGEVSNPGLRRVAASIVIGPCEDPEFVARLAGEIEPDFCLPGPEGPLAAGVVDRLLAMGIPSVGPVKSLARLETSKSFTRALLDEFAIPGNPQYRLFETDKGLGAYLRELGEYVVKPDGLTGGKGVKVSGDHLATADEGLAYCRELFAAGGKVVIEEKLVGEEFSLQSFCDGHTVVDMIPAQDHKRRFEGDRGPNTGGMGSYSCADQLLPFLTAQDVALASGINRSVAQALREKTGEPYKGVLYGGFIVTARGLRLIEYNARFADPEAMNVLAVLETDFLDICQAIIDGALHQLPVTFARKASVCKYVVPESYPDRPVKGSPVELPSVDNGAGNLRMYYGAIGERADGQLVLTGSRAAAFVGIGETLAEAEQNAERGAASVRGPVDHRRDIGATALVAQRVEHMRALRSGAAAWAVA